MLNMLAALSKPAPKTYIEDVFLVNTRTGTGATASVTGGPNLATYGGMVHIKNRGAASSHRVFTASRGVGQQLYTDATNGQGYDAATLTAFNSDGYSLGDGPNVNQGSATYVDWTFRNARNFFKETTLTKTGGSNATLDLSPYMATVGMVKVKRTDSTGSWYVWHRSLTAGKLLIGETTAAETTLGHITVSGTTLTLVDGVIADGTYHIEAYAHDTSADGLIQCGIYTGTGGKLDINVNSETQTVLIKRTDTTANWVFADIARGMAHGTCNLLFHNLSNAEDNAGSLAIYPNATGFTVEAADARFNASGGTYIYMAIRRGPMRQPTSGTQVYQAIARTGTGAAATVTGVGFPPDLVIPKRRAAADEAVWMDRLRGASQFLWSPTTDAEQTDAAALKSFDMDGVSFGDDGSWGKVNFSGRTYINWFFRRYPGVFDFFADTGTGSNKTETHNLTVAPKFWFRKGRSGATQWVFGSTLLAATEKIVSPSPAGKVTDATAWNSTYPTATAFSVGTAAATNTSAATYITYLVGEVAGVSKVDLYTGSSSDVSVDCGFAAGARLVLAVRVDTGGSFVIVDSVRGIVAGNDPSLCLDTTAAEVTTADIIDPLASGFIAVAGGLLNPAAGAQMLFVAIA
jgi:hypothetical protein